VGSWPGSCSATYLALVAAEERETWTGLRNQGSQLLSTGIGIGAAGAARDWPATDCTSRCQVCLACLACLACLLRRTCRLRLRRCKDMAWHRVKVSRELCTRCPRLLPTARPLCCTAESCSGTSGILVGLLIRQFPLPPRQALAQLRMHESSAATPPRGRSCTLTSSDGSRSRWPACSRRRPAALQWTSGLSSRDVQRLVHYTREEPTGRGSPSPMLVMRPIPPSPLSSSSAPLLLQPGAR
jgi:hypothetical protein